jgi:hypothetical protein
LVWSRYAHQIIVTACPVGAVSGGSQCVALAWPQRCAALASSCCKVRPSFPGVLVGSRFSPSSPYRTTPFPFLPLGTIVRTPPYRANPVPFFLLFPTQARTGSAPWPTLSPPRDPLVIPLHAASTFGALHHNLCPPSFIMQPCLLLLHSTPRSRVELIVSTFSVSALVGEAREAIGKE